MGGHSLSLTHLWGLVVRHADLFYPYMQHLIAQMVNSFSRLAAPPVASSAQSLVQAQEYWPVVHDMGLCIVYWIRNLLSGRPLAPRTPVDTLTLAKRGSSLLPGALDDSSVRESKRIKLSDGVLARQDSIMPDLPTMPSASLPDMGASLPALAHLNSDDIVMRYGDAYH